MKLGVLFLSVLLSSVLCMDLEPSPPCSPRHDQLALPIPAPFIHGLHSPDPNICSLALGELNKTFSHLGSELQINSILHAGILPRISSLAMGEDHGHAGHVRVNAVRLLSNMLTGTPQQCLWLASNNILPVILHQFTSNDKALLSEAVLAVGNAAADCPQLRAHLVGEGMVQRLLTHILLEIHEGLQHIGFVEETVWALSIFLEDASGLPAETFERALAVLSSLLQVTAAPQYSNIHMTLFKTLLNLVKREPERDYRYIMASGLAIIPILPPPTLRLVGELVLANDVYGDCFVECGGLLYLKGLLEDVELADHIRNQVLWILFNLSAGSSNSRIAVANAGLLPLILPLLSESFRAGKDVCRIAWNLYGLAVENRDFGQYLLSLQLLEHLLAALSLALKPLYSRTEDGLEIIKTALELIVGFLDVYPEQAKGILLGLWLMPEEEGSGSAHSLVKQLLSLQQQFISALVTRITDTLFHR